MNMIIARLKTLNDVQWGSKKLRIFFGARRHTQRNGYTAISANNKIYLFSLHNEQRTPLYQDIDLLFIWSFPLCKQSIVHLTFSLLRNLLCDTTQLLRSSIDRIWKEFSVDLFQLAMLGVERWDVDRLDADRMGVCSKMSWELRSLLKKGSLCLLYVHQKKMLLFKFCIYSESENL